MKLTEMFPTSLLKAKDVTDNGGQMNLIISKVDMQNFNNDNGGKEKKAIIHFTNEKQMVCNKTNANALFSMLGEDTDMWVNKSVTLIVMDVDFQGKQTPAIRVKNMNNKDMMIQEFWRKAKQEHFMSDEMGQALIKKHEGDFYAALKELDIQF